MTLYFLGDEVETEGGCDDGWVWGRWTDRKGSPKTAWFWMMQLDATP